MPRIKKNATPKQEDIVTQQDSPPGPMFLGKKERDLVKQVNDEIIEKVVGQALLYYPIDRATTNYHPIYGEAIHKNFLNPIKINALIKWEGEGTETDEFGVDRRSSITVNFHRRRLAEDQDLYVREGDFVLYGDTYYEIATLNNPKNLFGQVDYKFEITAKCVKARESMFNPK
jgi:hypothetical protein